MMEHLTSRDNPRLKSIAKLAASARACREAGLALLDGVHLVETWLMRAGVVQTVVVAVESLQKAQIASCVDRAAQAGCREILSVPQRLFAKLALVEAPSGLLALAPIPVMPPLAPLADSLLLDGVQDPGNVGSIIRSAAAAGFAQVLLSPDCAQPWGAKVLRAGMGAHVFVPIHERVDLAAWLAEYRGVAAATVLHGHCADLYRTRLPQPIAWVFGSEGRGVHSSLLSLCALKIRIPMLPGVESLNVAAAAAVCLFETLRQRKPAA